MKKVNLFFIFLFTVSLNSLSGQPTILSDVDPCSGKLFLLDDYPDYDTSWTYVEVIKNFYLKNNKVPIELFSFINSKELGVNIFRDANSESYIISAGSKSDSLQHEIYAVFNIAEYDFSKYNPNESFIPLISLLGDSLDLDARDLYGVPQLPLEMPNSYSVQVGIGNRENNILSTPKYKSKWFLRPVLINPELDLTLPTRPRAFMSEDSSYMVLYVFTIPDRDKQIETAASKSERALMRVLIRFKPYVTIDYLLVPPSILSRYGFEYGGCFEKSFF